MEEIKIGDRVSYHGASPYIPVGSIGIVEKQISKTMYIVVFPDSSKRQYRYGVKVSIYYIQKEGVKDVKDKGQS